MVRQLRPHQAKKNYCPDVQIQLNQKLHRSPQLRGRICPGLPDFRRLQRASLPTVLGGRGRPVSLLGMAEACSGGMGGAGTGVGAGALRHPADQRAAIFPGTPPVPQRGDHGSVLDPVHGERGLHIPQGAAAMGHVPPATSMNPR